MRVPSVVVEGVVQDQVPELQVVLEVAAPDMLMVRPVWQVPPNVAVLKLDLMGTIASRNKAGP